MAVDVDSAIPTHISDAERDDFAGNSRPAFAGIMGGRRT
jgi:hypothetical protein